MTPERTSEGKGPNIRIIRAVPNRLDPLRINGEPYFRFVGIHQGDRGLEFYRLSDKSTDYIKGPFFDLGGGFFINNQEGKWERFNPKLGEILKYLFLSSRYPMKSIAQNFKDIMHDYLLYDNPKKTPGKNED